MRLLQNMAALPTYGSAAETHADWMEFRALTSADDFASWVSHQRDLKVAGSLDADSGTARADEKLEQLVEDVIAELSDRRSHCGGDESYPFVVHASGLEYVDRPASLAYRFQLLLTVFGHDAAPSVERGDRLFEDLAAEALFNYLGGGSGAQRSVFGFPRRLMPTNFREAVDTLCDSLGEGEGVQDVPEASGQKDAYLDVVAWRHFPDRRLGKLIMFGQCATGLNWKDKYRDLQPQKWCRAWMRRMPMVDPVPAFFIPRRAEPAYWRRTSIYGGILFDRCRVAAFVADPEPELRKKLRSWIAEALATEAVL